LIRFFFFALNTIGFSKKNSSFHIVFNDDGKLAFPGRKTNVLIATFQNYLTPHPKVKKVSFHIISNEGDKRLKNDSANPDSSKLSDPPLTVSPYTSS